MAPITGVITPQFGTSTKQPLIPEEAFPDKLTSKEKCEKAGGFWDEEKQVCLLVKKEDLPIGTSGVQTGGATGSTKGPTGIPQVFTEVGTGKAGGIRLPSGRILLGLDLRDIEQILQAEQRKSQTLVAQTLRGQEQLQLQEQEGRRLQQSLSKLGKVDPTTLGLERIQQADIDWGQAITAGTLGSAPSVIGAAATGAVAGAFAGTQVGAIGGPVGAVALGVIGAAVGIWRGIQSNIKEQQRGEIGATSADLQAGQLKMRQYAMAASRDPYHVDYYIQLYNNEKANLYISERQLKTEVTGNLNKWMDDGRVQLAKFDDFLAEGGIADIYENKLRISLQMGVPLMPEDFGGEVS